MNKDYLLVKFCHDWADEFDVYGFSIHTKEEWEAHKKRVKSIPNLFPQDMYFGTNEYIKFKTVEDYTENYCKIIEITKDEYDVLFKFFGKDYGHSFFMDDDFLTELEEYAKEEEED